MLVRFAQPPLRPPLVCWEFNESGFVDCRLKFGWSRQFAEYPTTKVRRAYRAAASYILHTKRLVDIIGKLSKIISDDDLTLKLTALAFLWQSLRRLLLLEQTQDGHLIGSDRSGVPIGEMVMGGMKTHTGKLSIALRSPLTMPAAPNGATAANRSG
jgi:hypothetical protein